MASRNESFLSCWLLNCAVRFLHLACPNGLPKVVLDRRVNHRLLQVDLACVCPGNTSWLRRIGCTIMWHLFHHVKAEVGDWQMRSDSLNFVFWGMIFGE